MELAGLLAGPVVDTFPYAGRTVVAESTGRTAKASAFLAGLRPYSYGDSTGFTPVSLFIRICGTNPGQM